MRQYTCIRCPDDANLWETPSRRGPLPTVCDDCRRAAGEKVQSKVVATRVEQPPPKFSDPFGLMAPAAEDPFTKPASPPAGGSGVTPPHWTGHPSTTEDEAGPLETQLRLELDQLSSRLAMAGTLTTVALTLSRLADQTSDVRAKMAALKEVRSIVTQLTGKTAAEPAPAESDPSEPEPELDGPFGFCGPELAPVVDLGECVPRWATPRRYERKTWGPYFARVAAAMGKPFMPWQQHAADLSGEVDLRGILCYRQVVITVPRQSGKTTFVLAVVVGRAEAGEPFGGRQSCLYAAQTKEDATKKFNKEYLPVLRSSEVTRNSFISRIQSGSPTVTFNRTQTTFAPTTSGKKAGHGEILDLGIIDEAFSQPDDSVEGGWRPAMITRRMAQLIIPSTAGDATSTYFRMKVDAGRAAAELDTGSGTAYIEYSADEKAPGFDPGDEDLWRKVMPALGHTQSLEAIRDEYRTLVLEGKLSIWLRAFLNVWVDRRSDPVFRAGRWEKCYRPDTKRKTRPVIAVDISQDRSHTSVAMGAVGEDLIPMVRLIEYRTGTDWVVDRVLELRDQYDIAAVVLDAVGPARSLIDDFTNNYVDLTVTTANEMAGACGQFYDAVDNGQVSHLGEPALELAVNGAEKRQLGDSWAWTRTKSAQETGTDISPLVACTLAYWGQIRFGDDGTEEFPGSFQ